MRRLALSVACGAVFGGAAVAAGAADRPNVIFILADDLGYGDLGSYGQQVIRTPALDRMAAEGIRFTQFYAGATVCAPSRSVLMTGQHTGHTHVRGNAAGTAQSLRDEDVTVAEVLKSAGYATGLFGKWGLGEVDMEGHPLRQGFDAFFGYLNQVHAHNYYPEFLWRGLEKVRGIKRDLYDGGIRVPFLAWWPGTIEPGQVSDHIGYFGDVMATVADLSGVDTPPSTDSISFVPTLHGRPGDQEAHDYLYWEFYEAGSAQAVRLRQWKGVRKPMLTGGLELYDVVRDPGEKYDVARNHPEVVEEIARIMAEAHVPHPNWEPPSGR